MITRTGRWIDFKNDYKTMDLKFMESVWWVFAQLFDKGLVYKGFKVCQLVLSLFLLFLFLSISSEHFVELFQLFISFSCIG